MLPKVGDIVEFKQNPNIFYEVTFHDSIAGIYELRNTNTGFITVEYELFFNNQPNNWKFVHNQTSVPIKKDRETPNIGELIVYIGIPCLVNKFDPMTGYYELVPQGNLFSNNPHFVSKKWFESALSNWDSLESIKKSIIKKCECGAESIGSSGHSSYCPKYEVSNA